MFTGGTIWLLTHGHLFASAIPQVVSLDMEPGGVLRRFESHAWACWVPSVLHMSPNWTPRNVRLPFANTQLP